MGRAVSLRQPVLWRAVQIVLSTDRNDHFEVGCESGLAGNSSLRGTSIASSTVNAVMDRFRDNFSILNSKLEQALCGSG